MGVLASLKVLVGADTSTFHSSMAKVDEKVQHSAGTMANAGRAMNAGISRPLLVAGAMAQQFGGRLAGAATDAGLMTGATGNLAGSLVNLSESALMSVTAMGKISKGTMSFSTMSAGAAMGTAGLATAVLLGSKALTEFAMNLLNIHPVLERFAKLAKSSAEIAGTYTRDEFDQAAAALARLKEKLHLTGVEWQFSATYTKENALRVSELTEKLLKVPHAVGTLVQSMINGAKSWGQQFRDTNAAILKSTDDIMAKQYEAFGLMSKPALLEGMNSLGRQVKAWVADGLSWEAILAAVNPKLDDMATAAGKFKDEKLTNNVSDLREAITGEWVGGIDTVLARINKVPTSLSAATNESKLALIQMGVDLKGSISGGFGMGVQEGINAGKQALDKWIADMKSKPMIFEAKFDVESLAAQLKALGIKVGIPGAGI